MPTIDRGLSCTVLVLDKEYIMVDCGDGTCRQYLKSNLKWNKPLTILITHMHSDHTMGILGLLQSMDLMGRTTPITIYGVRGISKFINDVNRSVNFKFGFEFKVIELTEGIIIHNNYTITMCKTKHQVPSLAYRITLPDKEGKLDIDKCVELGMSKNDSLLGELKSGKNIIIRIGDTFKTINSEDVVAPPTKGLTIGFSGDTRPIPELIKFFDGVDYLTFESTFLEDELPLAIKAKHSTAKEAGELAHVAYVKTLLLNHFSARHTNTKGFYEEASKHHHNVIVTRDFLEIELK